MRLVGGPEVTPPPQQLQALRNGIVDIVLIPTGQTVALVPEAYAVQGSTVPSAQMRTNGTYDLLDKIYQEKIGAKFLYHLAPGGAFYIFFLKEPKLDAASNLTLEGIRVRSAAPWVKFVESLGGTNIVVPPPDTYSALERNMVDANI
ncbi:MAG: hypothetical protein EXR27_20890 [Betaproteobacteria bacterium]|nr:hypothetical protein [Betaproteobacteria bacterium]